MPLENALCNALANALDGQDELLTEMSKLLHGEEISGTKAALEELADRMDAAMARESEAFLAWRQHCLSS